MCAGLTCQTAVFFTASWYAGDDFYPANGKHNVNRPRFNFGSKNGMLKARAVAESVLTDKLKELRKELLDDDNT